MLLLVYTCRRLIDLSDCRYGWISAEIDRYPDYVVYSTHGYWTFIFRFAELVSRVFTLAAFGCAWRSFTFLLVFIDILIVTTLNLCHAVGEAGLDNLEGNHVSGKVELFFACVSTVAYVGHPQRGLSSVCLPGAIVNVTPYYIFRVCEMAFMALLWRLELHELAKMSITDNRTCYDQKYLLGLAGLFTVVLAVAVPVLWYVDPRNSSWFNGEIVPVADGGAPADGSVPGADDDSEEEMWAKNEWESDSDGEGGEATRPRSVLKSRGSGAPAGGRSEFSRGSMAGSVGSRGGKLMMNETSSTIGWLPVDPGMDSTDDPTQRPGAVEISSSEDEAEEEYTPFTEEELEAIPEHGFQRAIVKVMTNPDVPQAFKSRKVQQLVTRRNLLQAEKVRKRLARGVTSGALQKWGNPKLRALVAQLGIEESSGGDLSRDDIQQAFDEVDEDKGGTLDREEIHKLAVTLLGRMVKAPEVDQMMKEMDEDGGGDVDFDEFYAWFTGPKAGPLKAALKMKAGMGQGEMIKMICDSGFELDPVAIAAEEEAREEAARFACEQAQIVDEGRKAARAAEMAEIKASLEMARKGNAAAASPAAAAAGQSIAARARRMRRTSVAMLQDDEGP